MKIPNDVHNQDEQSPELKTAGESKKDRELDAFLSIAGTDVPFANGHDLCCDCGCEFDFEDDNDL